MLSLSRKVHYSRAHDLGATLSVEIERLDFRSALVIEESTALRGSIVQLLKKRGWIAHGIRVADQAFPLLKCIPGVRSAKRSTWLSDLIKILTDLAAHGRWQKQAYAS